ncbi:MAG: hypothetical protein R3B51_10035 [Thermodesulfobacteriota bacterium]
MSIYDVAPTVLNLFGMDPPENIAGKSITAAPSGGIKRLLKKIGNWL